MRSILVVIILLAKCLNLESSKVELAINCGSNTDLKSYEGFIYQKDEFYTESRVSDYSTNREYNQKQFSLTSDPIVYLQERHHDSDFSYNLPFINKNGYYTLVLKFSEVYFQEEHQRVFDIDIGQYPLLIGLDVVKEVGPYAALDKYFEIEIKDGFPYYHGQKVSSEPYKITIHIRLGQKDLPNIHGILLIDAPLNQSGYDQYMLEKKKHQNQRQETIELEREERKRQEKIRNLSLNHSTNESLAEINEEPYLDAILRILTKTHIGYIIDGLVAIFLLIIAIIN